MRLMREDEYEPLRMKCDFGLGNESRLSAPRHYRKSTEETGRAASRPSEVAAGGMPVSAPLAGVETGQGKALEAYLL